MATKRETPLRYYTDLMDRVFGDVSKRTFERGLDVGTMMREPAFREISEKFREAKTSAKMVIFPDISDMAFEDFSQFMKHHKFDVERDSFGDIHIKMSVRQR